MKVLFRADASVQIGSGHVMRCLALAQEIRRCGGSAGFLCREEAGHLCEAIQREGFVVDRLPAQAHFTWDEDAQVCLGILGGCQYDWLVVDHYGIDEHWETAIRQTGCHTFVIDDLTNRSHDCDLLLNQNLLEINPYHTLVPPSCKILLGPRYALLREEFRLARIGMGARQGTVRRMVVSFGGSDPSGETVKAVTALRQLNPTDIEVDVIVGESNPGKSAVAELCATLPYVRFHCQVTNMAHFLAQADLALGAAGVSSWERLAVGLPALVVAVADNQVENMRQLDRMGVAVGLGIASEVTDSTLAEALERTLAHPEAVSAMSKQALGLVDGEGVRRVVERMAARVM